MKNFVLIGAAGYIAPMHMKAIKETGNYLIAALDKHDSVGVLDSYFPDAYFFTEFERFDRHLEKLKREGKAIDFLVVCTPNYLHDAHIRYGLKLGADVICEKPIVLNPWNVDALTLIEKETNKKAFSILQLRLHPAIQELKKKVDAGSKNEKYKVDLQYITSRGNWYHNSWKGDIEKSGGIATNIGIHFFDMLLWIFGSVEESIVTQHNQSTATGMLTLKNAHINWTLSIDEQNLPENLRSAGKKTMRQLKIDDASIEFNEGFDDLHTLSYQEILNGNGFGLLESRKAIELVHLIRKG